jgi:hypothetical protein
MIVPDGKGGFLANARAELDELASVIGENIAVGDTGEDIDTIGGLIFGITGRIPVRGELVSTPSGYEFEILDADPRRIKRVRITRRPPAEQRRRQRTPPDSGNVSGSSSGSGSASASGAGSGAGPGSEPGPESGTPPSAA